MEGNMQNLLIRGSSYVVVATDPNSKTPAGNPKRVWKDIGPVADWKALGKAALIRKVHTTVEAIRTGKSLDGPETFERVFADFMKRHVEKNGLITVKDIRRNIANHVMPTLGARDFPSIRRGDIAKLLDEVEENAGPVMADKVLGIMSKICRWYATRHGDYTSPVVPGMNRSNTKERARARILNDDEIRIVWKAAEVNGVFGASVRMSLLTGQRYGKLSHMKWEHIKDGVWSIPQAPREKGTAGDLVLPKEAMDILDKLPHFTCGYVFTNGKVPISDNYKKAFAAKVQIAPWVIHDLRRTAKSLMARAGVMPHVSERVLGHVIRGVEGVYDQHSYTQEKADALRKLAGLIALIVNPPADNVVSLHG
jgi:integrase